MARAGHHLGDLDGLVTRFRDGEPYTLVKPEPTEVPDRIAYRLRYHQTPRVEISTTIGDVLHNLRSALDALAYGVAESVVGRTLTRTEEKAVEFPICVTPGEFDAYFTNPRRPERAVMFNAKARKALREQQPFAIAEHWEHATARERQKRYIEEFRWSGLPRLRHLHNIDKHRRLAVMAWWPDLLCGDPAKQARVGYSAGMAR